MIKLFEEYISKYKEGDYILFIDKDKVFNKEEDITSMGKITKVEWLDVIYYQVMTSDGFYTTVSQNEHLISRELTPEEINQFLMELETDKYNL